MPGRAKINVLMKFALTAIHNHEDDKTQLVNNLLKTLFNRAKNNFESSFLYYFSVN